MADNSDDPTTQNQDVIQGARAIRSKALTGSPNQTLADALMRRAATRPTTVGPNTSAAMNALARIAAAPFILANPPGNRPQ